MAIKFVLLFLTLAAVCYGAPYYYGEDRNGNNSQNVPVNPPNGNYDPNNQGGYNQYQNGLGYVNQRPYGTYNQGFPGFGNQNPGGFGSGGQGQVHRGGYKEYGY